MKNLLCGTLLLLAAASLHAQCTNLVWSDEFDGDALNLGNWNIQTGDGCDLGICGWGNDEAQYYREQNITVEDGLLKITAKRESFGGKAYTSARITTKDKQDFKFGHLEARIRLPEGGGLWPAFWMLSTDEVYGGWPQSGEIDIMEWVGNEPDELLGTIHFGQPWPNNSLSGSELRRRYEDWSGEFHTFAVDWTADRITWYVDGVSYGTKTRNDLGGQRWPFDQDFHFLLNMAVGGTLGGQIASDIFPATMEVDYVRVYEMSPPTMSVASNTVTAGEEATFTLNNLGDGATVSWTGPNGAIVIASGNSSARVTFGSDGGEVTAIVTDGDCEYRLSTEIFVAPSQALLFSLENFDDEPEATYVFSNGDLTEVANPEPNDVNNSALVGRYARDGGTQFDVIVYETEAIDNADEYFDNAKTFTIDVNTMAAVGTEILLQLESSRAEGDNYPVGRHSRYVATTTVQGEWERLTFVPLDQPDASTPTGSIAKLILLFNSNTRTNDVYFYDNLNANGEATDRVRVLDAVDFPLTVLPNPAGPTAQLRFTPPVAGPLELLLTDLHGRQLQRLSVRAVAGEHREHLDLSGLPAGVYLLTARTAVGARTVRLVRQ